MGPAHTKEMQKQTLFAKPPPPPYTAPEVPGKPTIAHKLNPKPYNFEIKAPFCSSGAVRDVPPYTSSPEYGFSYPPPPLIIKVPIKDC